MNLSKTFLRRKLLIATLLGSALFLGFIFNFILKSPIQSSSASLPPNVIAPSSVRIFDLPKQEQVRPGLPVRLKIPALNIDAAIQYVGLTPKGAVGVPKGPVDVAWYELGPRPGEKGSSIIDGHSGWKNNIPAVFDNLYKLHKGDKIYVESDTGEVITFVVREFRTYGPKENAPDVFGSSDGESHLNLITCTGIWNTISKSRSKRLVVFTDREME